MSCLLRQRAASPGPRCALAWINILLAHEGHQLRSSGISIFYDNYEVANLWGKNLTEHFHQVYGGTSRFCVMFISQQYAEKIWPSHERRSAFDAAITRRMEYILPVRLMIPRSPVL
jgi:hypothetical protein